jgi:hypothetical protein
VVAHFADPSGDVDLAGTILPGCEAEMSADGPRSSKPRRIVNTGLERHRGVRTHTWYRHQQTTDRVVLRRRDDLPVKYENLAHDRGARLQQGLNDCLQDTGSIYRFEDVFGKVARTCQNLDPFQAQQTADRVLQNNPLAVERASRGQPHAPALAFLRLDQIAADQSI